MNQYLLDTKYAVENLFLVIYQQHNQLKEALKSHQMMKQAEKDIFENMKEIGFTPEGVLDLSGFSLAAERFEGDRKGIVQVLNSIGASLSIVAGSILQIAKQGISTVHTRLSFCPNGRMIGKETLKNVIWQGRNQAMHFEEGSYDPPTVACFQNLEHRYGTRFQLGRKNLAFDVISILGWTAYDVYERDMKNLLQ